MARLEYYPILLGYPSLQLYQAHSLLDPSLSNNRSTQSRLLPIVVSAATDQTHLSTEWLMVDNTNVIRNYGNLIIDLCKFVPDGLVVYFPSFELMEDFTFRWKKMSILDEIMANKLLLVETREPIRSQDGRTQISAQAQNAQVAISLPNLRLSPHIESSPIPKGM